MAMTASKDYFNLKVDVVTVKTTANATIAVTGIATEDTIIQVLRIGATAGVVTEVSTVAVSAAGLVANSTASTAGKYIIFWCDNSL